MEKTSWFKEKRRDEHDEQEDRDQVKVQQEVVEQQVQAAGLLGAAAL